MFERLPDFRTSPRRAINTRSGAASVLVHALLLFWLIGGGARTLLLGSPAGAEDGPGAGTGIGAGPAGGGGGGAEVVTFYEIPTPAAPAAPAAPPEPEPVVPEEVFVPPRPEPTPTPPAETPPLATPGTGAATPGAGAGPLLGTGVGPGSGPGSGGGTGGGTGGGVGSGVGPGTGRGGGAEGEAGISAPVPQAVIFPPPAPREVRGRTVTLRLAVDARGRVQDVELLDRSGDSGYDRRLERTAREWRFNPARDAGGRAVAAPYEISFTF